MWAWEITGGMPSNHDPAATRGRARTRASAPPGSLAQIGVVAGDPIFAARGEDVHRQAIFERHNGVGHAGRDHQGLAGTDHLAAAIDREFERAALHRADLLVDVGVFGDYCLPL